MHTIFLENTCTVGSTVTVKSLKKQRETERVNFACMLNGLDADRVLEHWISKYAIIPNISCSVSVQCNWLQVAKKAPKSSARLQKHAILTLWRLWASNWWGMSHEPSYCYATSLAIYMVASKTEEYMTKMSLTRNVKYLLKMVCPSVCFKRVKKSFCTV